MDQTIRGYLGELLGTFFVVFVGAGTVCCYYLTHSPALDVKAFALAEGLTLGVMLTVTASLSQTCFNPAIAVMFYVFKRLELARMLALVGVQLVGAVLAGLVLRFCFETNVLMEAHMGTPHLRAFLSTDGVVTMAGLWSGLGIEILATTLVTLALFATVLDPRAPRVGGFGVGFAQIVVIVFAFRLTGGAANPARWFGPAVWQMTLPGWKALTPSPWADHAVYWAGPLVGALLGGFLYRLLIWPSDEKESTA